MAKVNFLNQAESFMWENYISQLHGNAYNKTRKWRYFIHGKDSEKDLNKIEARFAEGK